MDNTFEIRDEEIDVEEIMRKIRENIRMRKEAGIYPEGDIEEIHPDRENQDRSGEVKLTAFSPEARRDLDYVNSNWNIENKGYFISSHRPVAGRFLIRGRELVHGEVRRYVDPAIWKQREFNASTVRLLNEVARSIEKISAKLADIDGAIQGMRSEISDDYNSQISLAKSEVLRGIDADISKARSEIEAGIAQLDSGIDGRIDAKVGLTRSEIEASISQLDSGIDERIDAKVGLTRSEIESGIAQINSGIDVRIDSKVSQTRSEIESGIARIDSKIEESVRKEANAVISAMDLEIKNMAWLASILEGRMKDFEDVPLSSESPDKDGMNYFVFEEAFRGSRETIKERQSAFVRYFEGSKNVLDIGCGRGEFLELLRDNGIGGRGIDSNEDMVAFCRSKGLDVERIDAISYLESLEDKSLDGVFLDQVVEHLRPDYMVKMLGLCYKKLKYGHYIVVETVNPLSFASLANFYADLTHVRPVHPETLKFLLGAMGFREVDVMFFSPMPDEGRLSRVELEEEKRGQMGRFAEIHNKNVDMMNSVIYGAQDYTSIGKK